MYARLRERNIATGPVQSGVTYAHAVQGQTEIPQTNVTQLNPTNITQLANDLTEIRQIMKNSMDQTGTVINLISAIVKNN
jgi:methyl coenzyme M reductase subunit C